MLFYKISYLKYYKSLSIKDIDKISCINILEFTFYTIYKNIIDLMFNHQ